MTPHSRSSGKFKRGAKTYWMSLLRFVVVLLAACGGSPGTTPHKPLHPNSITMLANDQDAYTQNFNPYNTASVISGTQRLIYEPLPYVNRLDGSGKGWLASSY